MLFFHFVHLTFLFRFFEDEERAKNRSGEKRSVFIQQFHEKKMSAGRKV